MKRNLLYVLGVVCLMTSCVEENFENPDGSPIDFSIDFLGNKRNDTHIGPFAATEAGKQEIVVWKAV